MILCTLKTNLLYTSNLTYSCSTPHHSITVSYDTTHTTSQHPSILRHLSHHITTSQHPKSPLTPHHSITASYITSHTTAQHHSILRHLSPSFPNHFTTTPHAKSPNPSTPLHDPPQPSTTQPITSASFRPTHQCRTQHPRPRTPQCSTSFPTTYPATP